MERQLDPAWPATCCKGPSRREIRVITKANTKRPILAKKVEAVLLEDGTRLAPISYHGGRHQAQCAACQGRPALPSIAALWSTP